MGRVLWGLVSAAIAISIGFVIAYLQARFLHVVYLKLVVAAVVAIVGGIMWFADSAGWMPDPPQTSSGLSLSEPTTPKARDRAVRRD